VSYAPVPVHQAIAASHRLGLGACVPCGVGELDVKSEAKYVGLALLMALGLYLAIYKWGGAPRSRRA
jgi:hypothetical protein